MFGWLRRRKTTPQIHYGYGQFPPRRQQALVNFTGPQGQGYDEIITALSCRNPQPIPVTVATANHAMQGVAFDSDGRTICISRGRTSRVVDCIVTHSLEDDTLYADFTD